MENEKRELLTTEQAADFLQISKSTLYKYMADDRKRIPHYKVGHRTIYFRVSELLEWVKTFEKK